MVCFNMYVYNREGTCVYYHEWNRPKSVKLGAGSVADDQKQMCGLLYSLRTLTAAIDPTGSTKPGASLRIGEGCTFHSYKTNSYKLHFMESPSGIKFVLNTDPDVQDLREALWNLYTEFFVTHVLKHPLYQYDQPFDFELFTSKVNLYFKQLGIN